jgi:transcriptional regulator with XRE-family HTH domain
VDDLIAELLAKKAAQGTLPAPRIRKAIRVEAGASQQQVADAIGVARATIAAYECGTRRPAGKHLTAYVAILERLAALA